MQGPTCELPAHKASPIEMWNGTKRLQTLVADVAPDTITIRSLDWVRCGRGAAGLAGQAAGELGWAGCGRAGRLCEHRLCALQPPSFPLLCAPAAPQDRDRFDIEFSLVEVRCAALRYTGLGDAQRSCAEHTCPCCCCCCSLRC